MENKQSCKGMPEYHYKSVYHYLYMGIKSREQ